MKQALINSQRTGDLTAVAFVDLDRFKLINDSLGHQTGDDLLKLIADRLQHCLRGGDTVARHGGDEFVVLLPHQKNLLTITDTVERMLAAVCKPWHVSGRILEITCSIGISIFPHDAEEADALLQHADSAMYKAKELGRNRYKYFAAEMNTNARHRLDLLHSLRAAIPNNEFTLHYQPKIHLASGTMVGAEALIRWNSPTRGIVSPMDFIPFAEENGLINLIGEWVLHTACTQAVAWQQAGYQPITVSVNLSPHQLARDDIVTIVDRTLRQSGLQARYLELEITETAVMGDVEKSLLMLQALKNLGVKISIDDFGTGYSSLYYLKRFPVDNLKIDRSFVTEITTEHQDAAIVTAIISLAHILHLNVIAEGVENDAQRQFLIDSGCDEGQGYFFSRPMPDHSFAQLLQRV